MFVIKNMKKEQADYRGGQSKLESADGGNFFLKGFTCVGRQTRAY